MLASSINSLGLVLAIAGVVLLWRFGLPEAVNRGGFGYIMLEGTDEAEKAKAQLYDRWARVGLFSLVAGFGLQLWSNWL